MNSNSTDTKEIRKFGVIAFIFFGFLYGLVVVGEYVGGEGGDFRFSRRYRLVVDREYVFGEYGGCVCGPGSRRILVVDGQDVSGERGVSVNENRCCLVCECGDELGAGRLTRGRDPSVLVIDRECVGDEVDLGVSAGDDGDG